MTDGPQNVKARLRDSCLGFRTFVTKPDISLSHEAVLLMKTMPSAAGIIIIIFPEKVACGGKTVTPFSS